MAWSLNKKSRTIPKYKEGRGKSTLSAHLNVFPLAVVNHDDDGGRVYLLNGGQVFQMKRKNRTEWDSQ